MSTTVGEAAIRPGTARGPVGPRAVDIGLALGIGAIVAVAATQAEEPGGRASASAGWLLALVVAALLLVRRRYPVAVLGGLILTTVVYNMTGFGGIGFVWPLLAGLYTAASAGRLMIAASVLTATFALDTGWLLLAEHHPLLPVLGMSVPDAVVAGLAIALGDAVRSRRGWAAETREGLRRVSEEKDRQAQQAIVEQRLRIAREIHDVTAHTLAVVAVQINVAADALPDEPEMAGRALDTARTVSHQAMGQLRTAVLVLREPGDLGAAPHDGLESPMPGLPDLPGLLDGFGGGLRVRLRESGVPGLVPATIGLTVYRIVQEALTNVARHAGATSAEVSLDYRPSAVTLRITDDGRGGEMPDRPGNGLIGMTERAAGVGGTLEAGPGPEGGFTVRARLPLTEDA